MSITTTHELARAARILRVSVLAVFAAGGCGSRSSSEPGPIDSGVETQVIFESGSYFMCGDCRCDGRVSYCAKLSGGPSIAGNCDNAVDGGPCTSGRCIGVLVTRDETWTALPREDRRDVLYLSPDEAPAVIAMLSTALAPS